MQVTFEGVRGSTPCASGLHARYGGNTSCVSVDAPGTEPIVLDLGTGLRRWGDRQPSDGSFRASALVTHFHFDHVQGLPFLSCADRPGARLDIYGPGETGSSVADMFNQFVRPPFFPVAIDQLRGTYATHDVVDAEFLIGGVHVRVRPVPHVGLTVGYRLSAGGCSLAYIPDHQAPAALDTIDDGVLELCRGVDLLIHDAQYTDDDWAAKSHWGHSTIDYAVRVAQVAGARALALFHHDPSRDDATIDVLARSAAERCAREVCAAGGAAAAPVVFAAAEGMTLDLSRSLRSQLHRSVAVGPMFRAG